MRIGELARRAGASARSIRYYEQQGLLLARRRDNGYRDYDEADLRLVREIRSLLVNGFDLEEIRPFIDCLHAGIQARRACPGGIDVYRRKLEELAKEQVGRLLVVKVDADSNPGLVRRYGTLSLPSLLLFDRGAERTRIVGAMPERRLLAELTPFLPAA